MSGVLSLGSNLGDRLAHLRGGLDALAARTRVVAVSPVYETAPVGGPVQDDYLNAVVLVAEERPDVLLSMARQAEAAEGRERGERWGPRTLDVDVVAAGSAVVDWPDLVVPHPRAHERAFVLAPWHDVDPAAVLPGRGAVADLLAAVGQAGVRRRDDLLLEVSG